MKDMRRRYASSEQWEIEKTYYEQLPARFTVQKALYTSKRESFKEIAKKYNIGQEIVAILENIIRAEAETILIKGESDEHSKS